ncbi:family 43 glycosylhydrolase [Solitalea koreensis]|uniref:Carbohydrate binding module (Family 6) n=1 Tax=Solitalea koreensis TaxID=543615 RepID=A0A521DJS4_9SPHI|nr:family 43 glycosylhydrolase [Solitalea koreensis]SMO71994.1 Carbohydrate binding module (family 6) [Solitalea koreensis]
MKKEYRLIVKLCHSLLFITACLTSSVVFSQNPIVPPGVYIADPEAHVGKDGHLYVYGSLDESNGYWCSHRHFILSSLDLKTWNIETNAFSSKGKNDEVPYTNELLFAPDCVTKGDSSYLYYCMPSGTFTEGVAAASSPLGPFENGTHLKGVYQIDPAVLLDDDGQAYFYWGQTAPKVAKLKPNMREIDTTTITNCLAGNYEDNYFNEGASIRKIGKLYYLIYAYGGRHNTRYQCTSLAYATSTSPMGPFQFRGVIIDNYGSNPVIENNHGSIQKFNGQWYVFYHRPSAGLKQFRKACIEPIKIEKDGSIREVEMSSQGASGPLPANMQIQAEWACQMSGNVRSQDFQSDNLWFGKLANLKNGDTAVYKYIQFGKATKNFVCKTLGGHGNGSVQVWVNDGRKKRMVADCEIKAYNKEDSYQIVSATLNESVEGKQAVTLLFKGFSEMPLDFDWFYFY